MKVIDLLNKIANDEIPKTILFDTEKYEYISGHYVRDYEGIHIDLNEDYNLYRCLNDEVEILDEEDEFIDIEEFKSFITNVGAVNESNIEEYIHILFKQQTALINNQKKIIQALKENE